MSLLRPYYTRSTFQGLDTIQEGVGRVVRAATGWVAIEGSDQPLVGLTVLAVAVGTDEVVQTLAIGETEAEGFFRLEWTPLPLPAEIALLILSPDGRLLLRSLHRLVAGAVLQVRLLVAQELL